MIDLTSLWIVLAVVAMLVLFKRLKKGLRHGKPSGVDVEADLLRACRGDRAMAERLIAHELEHNAELSRAGAALMALAKLRDDQR